MTPAELAYRVQGYNTRLEEFIWSQQLPPTWFDEGIDHIAVKAYNPDDYDLLIKTFLPLSDFASETIINERRIAAVRLIGTYALNIFQSFNKKPVSWLELMEARPEDQTDEPIALDHEEIYVARGLTPIKTVLRRKKIDYVDQENASHAWVSVTINNTLGDEVKFTDKSLKEIVKQDIKAGRAKLL